ncbi:hypothetical protein RI570_08870 [Brucella pseudogrignonensis]|uniref:putative adhesin n=1 Tax=Brucella pseudogrignonensis TaxID=419475 RepID=UPI0028B3E725|nr:hypothetical protein [Brucella pseudogrignonensis]MDT6940257.1 hypothetical protein [Brucella pseudogrignonensis]
MEESTLHSINIEERFIIDEPISEINLNKKFKKNNEFKEHTSFNNSFSNKNHHVNNDEYEKKIYKDIIIKSKKGGSATKAILTGHGGYTPRRYGIFPGSGKIELPSNIRVHFFTREGGLSVRNTLKNILAEDFNIYETIGEHEKIINYSLTKDKYTDGILPNEYYDIITIPDHIKTHFNELLKTISKTNHIYTDIYYTCCRVNKLNPIIISPPITHL